jgi:hypothetical protein
MKSTLEGIELRYQGGQLSWLTVYMLSTPGSLLDDRKTVREIRKNRENPFAGPRKSIDLEFRGLRGFSGQVLEYELSTSMSQVSTPGRPDHG